MRALALIAFLAATAAAAQDRGVSLAEQQEEKAKRHSEFSAGNGGVFFLVDEVLIGMLSGAFVGGLITNSADNLYPWFIGGGVLFGAAAAYLQYVHPIGLNTALVGALGGGMAFVASLGVLVAAKLTNAFAAIALMLLSIQVGVFAPILATWDSEDLKTGDAALVTAGSVYGLWVMGLAMMMMRGSGNLVDPVVPMLIAPAAGMGVGALFALLADPNPSRVLRLTVLPIGVGGVLMLTGLIFGVNYGLAAATAALGTAALFGLSLLFTSEEPPGPKVVPPAAPPASPANPGVRWSPVPVIVPAGLRNEGIAAGAGLAVVF